MTPPPFAVHLSDGVLAWPWLAGGFAVAALLVAAAARRVADADIPRIGVLTAAFFVASSIHVKTGPASVHLILNGLVGVMLGRRAPVAVAVGLGMQCALLQHGGYTALGVNTAVVGLPALAAGVVFPLLRRRLPPFAVGALVGGGTVAVTVVLNCGVLLLGGADDFATLAKWLLVPYAAVAVVEGLVVGVVVRYLERVRPGMLGGSPDRPG